MHFLHAMNKFHSLKYSCESGKRFNFDVYYTLFAVRRSEIYAVCTQDYGRECVYIGRSIPHTVSPSPTIMAGISATNISTISHVCNDIPLAFGVGYVCVRPTRIDAFWCIKYLWKSTTFYIIGSDTEESSIVVNGKYSDVRIQLQFESASIHHRISKAGMPVCSYELGHV